MISSQRHRRLRSAVQLLDRQRHIVGAAAVLVILLLSGLVLHRMLAEMRLADVAAAIAAVPAQALFASLLLTAASFLVLIGYDRSALHYVGRWLPLPIIALGSFCGYAIGNTVGFALLSGGSVRFRIYTAAGLASDDVGRVALFCVIAFGFGICAISGIGVLIRPALLAHVLDVPVALLQGVSLALMFGIGAFLVLCHQQRSIRWRGLTLPLPSVSLAVAQLVISAVDICLAGAALWVLLPEQFGFSYLAFLPLYCVAIVAGIMSHVPGGLGVFEAVILVALDSHTETSLLVGALIVYRLLYYVLPLAVAGSLLGLHEVRLMMPQRSEVMRRMVGVAGTLVPTAASVLIVIASGVLLAAAVLPAQPTHHAGAAAALPLPAVEAAHLLAGATAAVLLLLAPAVQYRLRTAYRVASCALVVGIGCLMVILSGYREAAALALIAVLLVAYHREFHRSGALLDQPLPVGWMLTWAGVLGAAGWLMLFAYRHIDYDSALWLLFAPDADASRALRSMLVALIIVFAVTAVRTRRGCGRTRGLSAPDAGNAAPGEAPEER